MPACVCESKRGRLIPRTDRPTDDRSRFFVSSSLVTTSSFPRGNETGERLASPPLRNKKRGELRDLSSSSNDPWPRDRTRSKEARTTFVFLPPSSIGRGQTLSFDLLQDNSTVFSFRAIMPCQMENVRNVGENGRGICCLREEWTREEEGAPLPPSNMLHPDGHLFYPATPLFLLLLRSAFFVGLLPVGRGEKRPEKLSIVDSPSSRIPQIFPFARAGGQRRR